MHVRFPYIARSGPEAFYALDTMYLPDRLSVFNIHIWKSDLFVCMMMIAFITIKSSLVPLIEGLCAQIYFRFEISVVCSHLLLFFFVKEKTC